MLKLRQDKKVYLIYELEKNMRKVDKQEINNKKSSRNKTIDFEVQKDNKYLQRVIKINSQANVQQIINTTINGDTLEILDYFPKKFVDLLIVDPPYNLSKNYHGNAFDKRKETDYEEYTKLWLSKVIPTLKDNATIYVCCDWDSSLVIGKVLKEHFKVRNRITWQREKGRGARSNWKNAMEDIWFATISNNYTFNVDDVKVRRKVIAPYKVDGVPKDWDETKEGNFRNSYPSNFWDDITIPFWSMAENTAHPTQKSEKLIARLVLASSNEGDIVFDPFLGSGTTSVVAKKLNRNYVGIEFNPQYCAWAEYRLEVAEEDKSIQGYVDGVFWERNTLGEQNKR